MELKLTERGLIKFLFSNFETILQLSSYEKDPLILRVSKRIWNLIQTQSGTLLISEDDKLENAY
jgi:hypothetical protein